MALRLSPHWGFSYIGAPWVSGAEGPKAFNCWGLVRYVQRKHYGIDVPHIPLSDTSHTSIVREFETNPERQNWVHVDTPKDGDLVEFGSSKRPHHIGVFVDVDGGGVLHSVEGSGVGFTPWNELDIFGWPNIKVYRHKTKV